MKLDRITNVDDARRAAKRTLPGVVFDYIDGAADDETTMRANRAAFDDVVFRPRMGTAALDPDLSTSVLGAELSMPLMLAPTGLVRIMHPHGAAGVARAAAGRGTISVLSSVAGAGVDEVSPQAPGRVWFQLYAAGGRPQADKLMAEAEAAGVGVLVVTIDTAALGNRERDRKHGVSPPLRVDAYNAVHLGPQVLAKPGWTYRMARDGVSTIRRSRAGGVEGDGMKALGFPMLNMVASPFTWADIEYFRSRWPGRLAVKGVLGGADARLAVDAGADGVIVSNHGGRQLEGAPATIRVLPEVVEAVGSSAEVLLDGGVRRGTHVVKALALGASGVFIGRAYLYALAAGGQPGVEHMLDLLRTEMSRTMTLLGCRRVADLGPDWVDPPRR